MIAPVASSIVTMRSSGAPGPRAMRAASRPDAASCPAAAAARACAGAPLRGAFGTMPDHCRCSLSQV